MIDRKKREERLEKSEKQAKKDWVAPRIEELPPLTELALGSMGAKGTSTSWSFN